MLLLLQIMVVQGVMEWFMVPGGQLTSPWRSDQLSWEPCGWQGFCESVSCSQSAGWMPADMRVCRSSSLRLVYSTLWPPRVRLYVFVFGWSSVFINLNANIDILWRSIMILGAGVFSSNSNGTVDFQLSGPSITTDYRQSSTIKLSVSSQRR